MKKIISIFLFSLVFLISPYGSEASQEQILNPNSVSLTVFAGEYFGNVKAMITSNDELVQNIELVVKNEKVIIPKEVYGYLKKPFLNSFQIRTERGYDEYPHLYVYLELQYKTDNGEWIPKKVHLDYYNGVIQSINIQTPKDKNSYSWDSIKL